MAFDNPDYVDVVLHSYRHRLGLSPGRPPYEEIEERLAEQPAITVPAVTLDGLADGNFPATDGSACAHLFTGPRVHRQVPNAGHNLPQEAPDAFASAIPEVANLGSQIFDHHPAERDAPDSASQDGARDDLSLNEVNVSTPSLLADGHMSTHTRITTPFSKDSTAAQVLAGVDLSRRRAIVTGGASGIGVETARAGQRRRRRDPAVVDDGPNCDSSASRIRRPTA